MTSTPYGSGPLPDPESGGGRVPEERDWNEGQRTTRRAALLTAAGFGLAGTLRCSTTALAGACAASVALRRQTVASKEGA